MLGADHFATTEPDEIQHHITPRAMSSELCICSTTATSSRPIKADWSKSKSVIRKGLGGSSASPQQGKELEAYINQSSRTGVPIFTKPG